MIVVPGNLTVYCDVDETLIMWNPTQEELDQYGVEIECPGGMFPVDGELQQSPSWKAKVLPHRFHIEQIKKHKLRGHTTVVWSAGGYDWAERVVIALGLENFVDLVICKPTWTYDDLKPEEFMPKSKWEQDKP